MTRWRNPERPWERPNGARGFDPSEVESRVGEVPYFALSNLAGLLAGSEPDSRRATDLARRIVETLDVLR
jgi:hypothetical protein